MRREDLRPTEEERREKKRKEDREGVKDNMEHMNGVFMELTRLKSKIVQMNKGTEIVLVEKRDWLVRVEMQLEDVRALLASLDMEKKVLEEDVTELEGSLVEETASLRTVESELGKNKE